MKPKHNSVCSQLVYVFAIQWVLFLGGCMPSIDIGEISVRPSPIVPAGGRVEISASVKGRLPEQTTFRFRPEGRCQPPENQHLLTTFQAPVLERNQTESNVVVHIEAVRAGKVLATRVCNITVVRAEQATQTSHPGVAGPSGGQLAAVVGPGQENPRDETTKGLHVVEPSKTTVAHFTSGVGNEKGRQEFELRLTSPGRYLLSLENANGAYSDHWLLWDAILLKRSRTADQSIWSVGNDDVGMRGDFSKQAFSEFAEKNAGGATSKFIIGKTQSKEFIKELNDNDVTRCEIEFTIDKEQLTGPPALVLSTLYSSHQGAPDGFRMHITVKQLPEATKP